MFLSIFGLFDPMVGNPNPRRHLVAKYDIASLPWFLFDYAIVLKITLVLVWPWTHT